MTTIVKNLNQSRREFLRAAGRLSIAGTAAPFALNLATIGAAAAQTANDYRALVCVFLYGANDHNNTVIPFDTASYTTYSAARATIARPMSALLPLTPSVGLTGSNAGRQFALPTELGPLRTIWDAGKLAVVANVGPLIVPTTKIVFAQRPAIGVASQFTRRRQKWLGWPHRRFDGFAKYKQRIHLQFSQWKRSFSGWAINGSLSSQFLRVDAHWRHRRTSVWIEHSERQFPLRHYDRER